MIDRLSDTDVRLIGLVVVVLTIMTVLVLVARYLDRRAERRERRRQARSLLRHPEGFYGWKRTREKPYYVRGSHSLDFHATPYRFNPWDETAVGEAVMPPFTQRDVEIDDDPRQ